MNSDPVETRIDLFVPYDFAIELADALSQLPGIRCSYEQRDEKPAALRGLRSDYGGLTAIAIVVVGQIAKTITEEIVKVIVAKMKERKVTVLLKRTDTEAAGFTPDLDEQEAREVLHDEITKRLPPQA